MLHIDPQKLIGDVLRLGTIEAIDLAAATCRVRVGEIVTGDIAWIAPRAGAVRIWAPPSLGEQVLLLCPDGDELAALALGGIFSDAHPAPNDDAVVHLAFDDGAAIRYDAASHTLDVLLPAGGTASIDAPGGLTITGPVTIDGRVSITGNVDVTGKLDASDDVIGGGKSLKGHIHKGVQPGSALSGPPQ